MIKWKFSINTPPPPSNDMCSAEDYRLYLIWCLKESWASHFPLLLTLCSITSVLMFLHVHCSLIQTSKVCLHQKPPKHNTTFIWRMIAFPLPIDRFDVWISGSFFRLLLKCMNISFATFWTGEGETHIIFLFYRINVCLSIKLKGMIMNCLYGLIIYNVRYMFNHKHFDESLIIPFFVPWSNFTLPFSCSLQMYPANQHELNWMQLAKILCCKVTQVMSWLLPP